MSDFTDPNDPILQRVQKLMDKAWSTTFPEERESLLAKAEELMLKYSIDMALLQDPNRPNSAPFVKFAKPELREIYYFGTDSAIAYEYGWDVINACQSMFFSLARHVGVKIGYHQPSKVKVVGFPADIDFLEMLYVGLKLHMMASISPTVDKALTWEENLAKFKNAGLKWEEIHYKLRGAHLPDYPYSNRAGDPHGRLWERPMGVRFTGVYKRWAEAHPEVPRNMDNPDAWRRGFIAGYVDMIHERLSRMRAAVVANDRNLPALISDKLDLVQIALEEFFPPPPPPTQEQLDAWAKEQASRRRRVAKYVPPAVSATAMRAGRDVAATADLSNPGSRIHTERREELG